MKFFTVLALAAACAWPALAQHLTFVVNPDASEVKMTLKTTHELVHGTFQVQSGSVAFDSSNAEISGSVVILAASGKTGNGSRDKKMHNEILQVEPYPTVSFEPKSYTGTIATSGDSSIQLSGVFTLLGKPHPVTIPVLVHLETTTATAKAHFVLPYIEWGLKDPSFLFWKANKDVAIDLLLIGQLSR